MIAVTFALPSESRDFRRLVRDRREEVAILHTGVGQKICRTRLEPFLDAQPLDFLISSGFAGGADPSLGVGDLLLAENFSDPTLLARARDLLTARLDRLVTTDRILDGPAERKEFARQHGAAAVDMETEWIARSCAGRQIPMLSLRVISDTTAAPFPVPPDVLFDLNRQRTRVPRLMAYLVRHPFAVVRLARFAQQINSAQTNLARALETLLS